MFLLMKTVAAIRASMFLANENPVWLEIKENAHDFQKAKGFWRDFSESIRKSISFCYVTCKSSNQ